MGQASFVRNQFGEIQLFIELGLRSFQRQIAYRAATLAGMVTNFFFAMLRASVIVALYGVQKQVESITMEGAVTYTGLTQAIIGFLGLFYWNELMQSVYTGAVATDLLKPMGYYQYWLAQDLGRAMFQLLIRGLPIMIVYTLLFDIVTPHNGWQWLGFGVALLQAWLISFSIRFLTNLSSFWVPNAMGFLRISSFIWLFASGFIMPLRFFPDWFQQICALLPFGYTVNTVVEVFLGVVTGRDMFYAIGAQFIWIVVLIGLSRLVLYAGLRKLVIQGG